MQAITSKDSTVYFQSEAYEQLNKYLTTTSHSSVFILVDTHTHENCLAHFMGQLEVDIPIEIIEIEAGEINKNICSCHLR